jgi:hypothetical protein
VRSKESKEAAKRMTSPQGHPFERYGLLDCNPPVGIARGLDIRLRNSRRREKSQNQLF